MTAFARMCPWSEAVNVWFLSFSRLLSERVDDQPGRGGAGILLLAGDELAVPDRMRRSASLSTMALVVLLPPLSVRTGLLPGPQPAWLPAAACISRAVS